MPELSWRAARDLDRLLHGPHFPGLDIVNSTRPPQTEVYQQRG